MTQAEKAHTSLRDVGFFRILLAMKLRGISLLVCAFGVLFLMPAASTSVPLKARAEELLSSLAAIDFGDVYVEDGAADGSVTEEWRLSESGPEAAAFAKVKAVVDLSAAAIPLLIQHLDDPRPTRTLFNGRPVPFGHVALDILSHIVGQNPIVFDVDCADDGLGACFSPGYYFRPNAPLTEMKRVKMKWQRLYRRNALQFAYPQLWQ
jgi:hypothetical protein